MNLCECAKYPDGTRFKSNIGHIRLDRTFFVRHGSNQIVAMDIDFLTADWQLVPQKVTLDGIRWHRNAYGCTRPQRREVSHPKDIAFSVNEYDRDGDITEEGISPNIKVWLASEGKMKYRLINFYLRIKLFLGILWRESPAGGRISLRLSWDIARTLKPLG